MITLYLIRHGIAEDTSSSGADEDRALTIDGERRIREIARALKQLGAEPEVVLSSTLLRARQTAEAVVEEIDPEIGIDVCHSLSPGGDPIETIRRMKDYRRARSLFLVGHEPSMSLLASQLLTGSSDAVAMAFKKGGVARIDFSALNPNGRGYLRWFATPKLLRLQG